ncbi:16S rRNA (cytidine(1402)-2'-O)-methyltransferase [Candidatus Woesebacteria bacterium]|nr:16S rRNA (cytidine(1402)-2'-O)-methyltransferase [Candidatus Woesebacteria bacterium]QQG47462.1 MAG: 16S rRNA (cytidine(1402)-2'-O)-methyltransferase [Candidatus Woesebacteria bacterium]
MAGSLFIVATPIGNLGDISLRALEILKSVDLILCEDTRKTRLLLMHYDIKTPLDSYHQHSSDKKYATIISLLRKGSSLALVTDAGTPSVSDPGNELVEFLTSNENGIKIISIPGASALTSSISICGFNMSKFEFLGFMPKKGRKKIFERIKEIDMPIIFFESPFRIRKTLTEILESVGDRRICVCRELTKIYETIYRGTISEVLSIMPEKIKGEIVVVVDK